MKNKNHQEGKEEDPLQILNKYPEVGIDEVGRGSIFGPIFSAVVVISRINAMKLKYLGVDDSKKLSSKKRSILLPNIYKGMQDALSNKGVLGKRFNVSPRLTSSTKPCLPFSAYLSKKSKVC